MDDIRNIWESVQATFKEMGAAAVQGGKRYGLRGYGDYYRELFPASQKKRWEEPITAGLVQRLRVRQIEASTEKRYPGQRTRCDLVIENTCLAPFWIEFKTAYREGIRGYDPDLPYEYYGKQSWQAGVGDVAAKDILKLKGL